MQMLSESFNLSNTEIVRVTFVVVDRYRIELASDIDIQH